MKKLIYVILLAALCVAANASDIIVGTTFGDTAKLTTVDYRVYQPVSKYMSSELVFGAAVGFRDLEQNTDVKKYSLGLGANLTNGDAKIAVGYVASYIDGLGGYPGAYGSVDFKISKDWFVQVKYTAIFNANVAEGWQCSVGFKL